MYVIRWKIGADKYRNFIKLYPMKMIFIKNEKKLNLTLKTIDIKKEKM